MNIMMPMMGQTTIESIMLLSNCCNAFVEFCLVDTEANEVACEAAVEKSLSMVTSLNPHIGYDKAAHIAKTAYAKGLTLRDVAVAEGILTAEQFDELVVPKDMLGPK